MTLRRIRALKRAARILCEPGDPDDMYVGTSITAMLKENAKLRESVEITAAFRDICCKCEDCEHNVARKLLEELKIK